MKCSVLASRPCTGTTTATLGRGMAETYLGAKPGRPIRRYTLRNSSCIQRSMLPARRERTDGPAAGPKARRRPFDSGCELARRPPAADAPPNADRPLALLKQPRPFPENGGGRCGAAASGRWARAGSERPSAGAGGPPPALPDDGPRLPMFREGVEDGLRRSLSQPVAFVQIGDDLTAHFIDQALAAGRSGSKRTIPRLAANVSASRPISSGLARTRISSCSWASNDRLASVAVRRRPPRSWGEPRRKRPVRRGRSASARRSGSRPGRGRPAFARRDGQA